MGFFPAEVQQGTMLGPLPFNGRYIESFVTLPVCGLCAMEQNVNK